MEEEKAAAYYEELTRKGSGAARFKQGLGFSSGADGSKSDDVPTRGSALVSSSSSFYSGFVRASSTSKEGDNDKKVQIETIQNKLKKKTGASDYQKSSRVLDDRSRDRKRSSETDVKYRDRDRHSRRRSRSRNRSRSWSPHRRRSSSRDRNRHRDRESDKRRRRRRSRSNSVSDGDRGRRKVRDRRSRSVSPRSRREKVTKRESKERATTGSAKDKIVVDYAKLIDDYDTMSAAERVKAKMKFQLSEAAETDATNKCMGPGWERFEFNKDAPLDDEEIEAAVEDDAAIVKRIGQSFRLSAVEAKREEQIKMDHDAAIFGTPSSTVRIIEDELEEEDESTEAMPAAAAAASLVSERVLGMQQGSWRDRARAPRRS